MTFVTSAQNPLVKHLAKLAKDASYRRETQKVLLESQKIILDAQEKFSFCSFCVPEKAHEAHPDATVLKSSVAEKISTLKTSDGFFAEIERPENADLSLCEKILVLDQIQNPQNMGSLMRSALAFGFDGVFIIDGSADPYSPKVVRTSMGACLHIPIAQGSYSELRDLLELTSRQILVADAQGLPLKKQTLTKPLALVMGNESSGPQFEEYPGYTHVCIEIDHIDSLNVAIAGSVLMHQLKEQLWA